jgi:multisubunit Na+/H+ antiporter MnhE subunit
MADVMAFLLVGRTPLGSALRAVVVSTLISLFWMLVIATRWQVFVVSLITALVVVVAAHLLSGRDNPFRRPDV